MFPREKLAHLFRGKESRGGSISVTSCFVSKSYINTKSGFFELLDQCDQMFCLKKIISVQNLVTLNQGYLKAYAGYAAKFF